MWMWQSAALRGAFSFGGSVPEEWGTAWLAPPVDMSGAFRRLGIPLALAHAGDGDALEHAVLREGIAVGERLRFGTAPHVDDEQAPDRLCAVVVLGRAGEHENFLLAAQVFPVRHQDLLAGRRGVRLVDAGNGPERHGSSPLRISDRR